MEERSIKISLERAREWYNRGGEYKELALSAFSEEEIKASMLPNTWEEFCEMHSVKCTEYFIDIDSIITGTTSNIKLPNADKNMLPSLEAAKAHLALMQLHQLRDCYRQGWVPNWNDGEQSKYTILYNSDNYTIDLVWRSQRFLSFQSQDIARKFLKNFKDLIETAGDLI